MNKELRKFLSKYKVRAYAKGELILCEGEVPHNTYFIKKGVVKVYDLTADGVEKPISFDVSNEVFPTSWIFGISRRTHYFYEAFTDCQLYMVPRDDYLSFMQNNQDLLIAQLYNFISRYLNFEIRVYAQSRITPAQKLLHALHFLALRFRKPYQRNPVKTNVPLTDQDIANFMGVPLKTARQELKKLEKTGVINRRFRQYSVHTNKLHALLDETFDMD